MKYRNKKIGENAFEINDKLISAMNYFTPEYRHTKTYCKYISNPLHYARNKLRKIASNSLVDENCIVYDVHDPMIDSFINTEITFGHKQYIENIGSILQIYSSISESECTAEIKKIQLLNDLEHIEKNIQKYTDML